MSPWGIPLDRDALGSRGEGLSTTLLTRFFGRNQPYFRPQFLGDKHPTIDLFVELVGANGPFTPYFLAQVKLTTLDFVGPAAKLPVRVTPTKMAMLVKYPAPTYVIGIKDPEETGFIVAALPNGPRSIARMVTTHPLALEQTLSDLYDEVEQFWQNNVTLFSASRFT
jgi:hypothetical protein